MINLEILYIFILESHHSNFINNILKDDNDAKFKIFQLIIHSENLHLQSESNHDGLVF